jgi:hypothetical protein
MIVERKRSLEENQTVNVNGVDFGVSLKELKEFLEHCSSFMDISKDGFETMINSISDSVVDNENPEITIEELRPQLKFMRELNLFLKTIYAVN